jgi:DNA-binding XRE family transcriptional regulator
MGEQLDLFSRLSQDQQRQIIEQLADAEYRALHGITVRPEPEFTAKSVRFQRHIWGWKKETLASFAGVSLSTIERIERGDRVSDDCLDRVAVALGYKRGDFTEPRVPLSCEEATAFLKRCLEPFEGTRWIDVEPVRKQWPDCGICELSSLPD